MHLPRICWSLSTYTSLPWGSDVVLGGFPGTPPPVRPPGRVASTCPAGSWGQHRGAGMGLRWLGPGLYSQICQDLGMQAALLSAYKEINRSMKVGLMNFADCSGKFC